MIISSDLRKKPDESIEQYLIRLGEKVETQELTWIQATELLNEASGEEYSEAKWRKDYASYLKWKDYLIKEIVQDDEYLQKINDASLELKKERIKLQSEKLEYNKMLREDARNELLEEKIFEAINNRPTIKVPEIIIKPNNKKRDYLFPVADIHYGAKFQISGWFDEILNEYSPEIAQKRMWQLLEQYVRQNDIDKINHVHLFNLGDSLDGILRMSQLQWISLGNVDAAIEFAEFMSTWLNELSKYSTVDYYAASGNHTELRLLNGKRGDFVHENMEKIITHIILCNLKDNKNVKIHKCKTYIYVDILGTKVLGVHGHEEKKLSDSIIEYPIVFGHPVDFLVAGHLHSLDGKTVGMRELRDIRYAQVPSIVGITDFSLRIKKVANPGAILMTFEEDVGRVAEYEFRIK